MKAPKMTEHVYLVGDCGLGTKKKLANIKELGFSTEQLGAVVNAHCHCRHAGGNHVTPTFDLL